MNIATHSDLTILRHWHIYQSGSLLLEQLHNVLDHHVGVLSGNILLCLLPLHEFFAKLWCEFSRLIARALVATVHSHGINIDCLAYGASPVARNGLGELLLINLPLALLILIPGILVLRQQLTQLRKVFERFLCATHGHIGCTTPVVGFWVISFGCNRRICIYYGQAKVFHLDVAKGSICVVDLNIWIDCPVQRVQIILTGAQVNGLGVRSQSLCKVCRLEKLVAFSFGLLGLCELTLSH
mmetsp:Transcript_55248/g.131716  ORF Transcript_55248/g.131716 Transcript_55248/m.131716 type:complete len:240 (-) Transcript_55248:106-825(-)